MALLPPVAKENDSDDDFEPLKKHPKLKDVEGIFPQSCILHYINCTCMVHCSTVLYTATLLCISILSDAISLIHAAVSIFGS